MQLDKQVLLGAAHYLYAHMWAQELENRGHHFAAGTDLYEACPDLPEEVQLPVINRYVGRVEGVWGVDVALVFHHMGLNEKDQERALSHLLMGCLGTGLSIHDDYHDALCRAAGVLNNDRINAPRAPFYFEGEEWRDLVEDSVNDWISPKED